MSAILAGIELILIGRDKPARQAKAIDALAERYSLRGLVVWRTPGSQVPPLPPALEVPFEALDLSGLDDRLPDLLEGQNLVGTHYEHWHRGRERKRFAWLIAPVAFVVAMIGAYGWQNPLGYIICLVGLPVFLVACFAVYCLYSRQWFAVPAGVVVRRRFLWFAARGKLQIFTPADSTLFICPEATDWAAHLCRDGRVRARTLGDRECMALLAAWQSPLRPPPPEQLEMLR